MNSTTPHRESWDYRNGQCDGGISHGDYVKQLTYRLLLKIADERSRRPYNHASLVLEDYVWPRLLAIDGDALCHTLERLGNRKSTLGLNFTKAHNKFQDPAMLRRVIVNLIDKEEWVSKSADVKGDTYDGLLKKNAQDTNSAAGENFTLRLLIQAILDVMAPKPGETVSDLACGTSRFLLAAHDFVVKHNPHLTNVRHKKFTEKPFRDLHPVQAPVGLLTISMLVHDISHEDSETNVVVGVVSDIEQRRPRKVIAWEVLEVLDAALERIRPGAGYSAIADAPGQRIAA